MQFYLEKHINGFLSFSFLSLLRSYPYICSICINLALSLQVNELQIKGVIQFQVEIVMCFMIEMLGSKCNSENLFFQVTMENNKGKWENTVAIHRGFNWIFSL